MPSDKTSTDLAEDLLAAASVRQCHDLSVTALLVEAASEINRLTAALKQREERQGEWPNTPAGDRYRREALGVE